MTEESLFCGTDIQQCAGSILLTMVYFVSFLYYYKLIKENLIKQDAINKSIIRSYTYCKKLMLLFLIIGTNIALITLIVLDDLPYFNYVVQSVSLIIDFSLLRLSYIEHRQLSQTSKRYREFLNWCIFFSLIQTYMHKNLDPLFDFYDISFLQLSFLFMFYAFVIQKPHNYQYSDIRAYQKKLVHQDNQELASEEQRSQDKARSSEQLSSGTANFNFFSNTEQQSLSNKQFSNFTIVRVIDGNCCLKYRNFVINKQIIVKYEQLKPFIQTVRMKYNSINIQMADDLIKQPGTTEIWQKLLDIIALEQNILNDFGSYIQSNNQQKWMIDYVRNIRKTYDNRRSSLFDIHNSMNQSYQIRIQNVNFKEKFIEYLNQDKQEKILFLMLKKS
ncbi:hypothetical protein pb186bvf_014844 [Paramecium bursaria]